MQQQANATQWDADFSWSPNSYLIWATQKGKNPTINLPRPGMKL